MLLLSIALPAALSSRRGPRAGSLTPFIPLFGQAVALFLALLIGLSGIEARSYGPLMYGLELLLLLANLSFAAILVREKWKGGPRLAGALGILVLQLALSPATLFLASLLLLLP